MKIFLIKLTHGVIEKDLPSKEKELLQELNTMGFLNLEDDKYTLNSKYRAGLIDLTQTGSAYLKVIGTSMKDLFIEASHLKGAGKDDLVIAQRLIGKRGKPSAVVAHIVGKAELFGVACIMINDGRKILNDLKTNTPVAITLAPKALDEYKEYDVFQIDYKSDSIKKYLGSLNDPHIDEDIALALFNRHKEFEPDILAQAKNFGVSVDTSQYPDRKDLRDLPFCTIDPVTAKDFDDAIYFDVKEHALYVAIADVSSYVEPFGAIDTEAMYRGFTVYFPHKSVPMLPRELSENLCSLRPNEDRLAFTFKMFIDPTSLEVTKTELYETLIHSRRRYTYAQVDDFFEGTLKAQNEHDKVTMAYLPALKELTQNLKRQRMIRGYDFRSREFDIDLNEEGLIQGVSSEDETPSHALIEDCMLLANKAAADMFEKGVYRIHESPSPLKLQSLYSQLFAIGIDVEIKGSIRQTISDIQKKAEELGIREEVDTLIIQSQMQAKYAPDNAGHFGLGFDSYTHFTSPIRRYSDLMVHRLLKSILAKDDEQGAYLMRNIDALCEQISILEREADYTAKDLENRKYARWASERIGTIVKARIISLEPAPVAILFDEIIGARIFLKGDEGLQLFGNVEIELIEASITSTKIYGRFIKHIESLEENILKIKIP
ncbi:VacB/RNase II family 3'-5' exoribonuclease [Sulfurimonas sp. MAG313]|nr:VacB/RNase II family 3'-5' exoribonuclease [Sulfurimonas sp. MAG313]MDF1881056.1 VacB/RNase II family 3'-5' exoribonuclease [Sulfurimonas sp. MAG313]